jgi:uncharacterized repeat protein (TIGR01451 family)
LPKGEQLLNTFNIPKRLRFSKSFAKNPRRLSLKETIATAGSKLLAPLIAFGIMLGANEAQAATFNLSLANGVLVSNGTGACTNVINTPCRYKNVVQGTAVPASLQRDLIVTYTLNSGGGTVDTLTAGVNSFDNDAIQFTPSGTTTASGPFRDDAFSPSVRAPSTTSATATTVSWVEFTFQFVTPNTLVANPLPGTVFITAFDVDGSAGDLREFVEFVDIPANQTGLSTGSSVAANTSVDGGTNYGAKTNINQSNLGDGAAYKASAQQANLGSFRLVIGARQSAGTNCGTGVACYKLSAYTFQIAESVVTTPVVDGYKSVKLTTDVNGDGIVNPGDGLTYSVTYVNTGNADASGFQISDPLPTGLTATQGSQTVRINGVLTAGNPLYTGTGSNTNLLSGTPTLSANGTIAVSIPVTVDAGVADNTTLSNQATATGTGISSTLSDNVDNTPLFAPSVVAATGFSAVPAGSVPQTQVPALSGTTVLVRRLPTLTLTKTIAAPGRNAPTDQFTVQIKNGNIVTANATTTGSNSTASTPATALVAGTTYTLTEIMAAGASTLADYTSAITCTNATSGSTTPLPNPGSVGQSFSLTPALGDVITCNLTNTDIILPPTIAKAFSPASVALNGVTTLTFTLTNPNSNTALSTLNFTDALSGMNVSSTVIGGTCSSVTNSPALAVNATALNLTVPTLAASASCTITVQVKGTSVGVNPNTTSGVTSTQTPTAGTPSGTVNLTVNPLALGVSKAFSPASVVAGAVTTLTITVTNPNGVAVTNFALKDDIRTTTGIAGLTISTPTTDTCKGTATPTTANGSYVLSGGTLPAGGCSVVMNVQVPASAATAATTNTIYGSTPSDVTGNANGISTPAPANATASLSVTALPTLTLITVSNGGVGTFNFMGDNGFGSDSITTTVIGTAVLGATKRLAAANAATIITETPAAGYSLSAVSCTGMGGSGTVSFSGNVLTLNAPATAAGNTIVCTLTNIKIPTVQLQKTSLGGMGAFSFMGNNGFGSDSITTATAGTAVLGTTKLLTALTTDTTITETVVASYITAITCSDSNAGVTGNNTPVVSATNSVTIPAANIKAGAVYTCSYTNTKVATAVAPAVTLSKLGRNVTNAAAVPPIPSPFTSTNVTVKPKDIVEYCIAYENTGGVAANFVLKDYVPVGMVIVPDAYGTGTGIRWSSTVKAASGDTAPPAGVNLTNITDSPVADQGTLNSTPVTNPTDPVDVNGNRPLRPGLMTFDLGATGLVTNGKGTVCFQAKVP